jgi:hypothetical protein
MLKVINPLKNKFEKNAGERLEPGAARQNSVQETIRAMLALSKIVRTAP